MLVLAVQVYRGLLQGSTPVAIKFISDQTLKEKLRFIQEIAVLKNLRHTNVGRLLAPSELLCAIMLHNIMLYIIIGLQMAKHFTALCVNTVIQHSCVHSPIPSLLLRTAS